MALAKKQNLDLYEEIHILSLWTFIWGGTKKAWIILLIFDIDISFSKILLLCAYFKPNSILPSRAIGYTSQSERQTGERDR